LYPSGVRSEYQPNNEQQDGSEMHKGRTPLGVTALEKSFVRSGSGIVRSDQSFFGRFLRKRLRSAGSLFLLLSFSAACSARVSKIRLHVGVPATEDLLQ